MSATALQSTYPTHHCECDFCCSRRSVNAKKMAVSQAASQRSGLQFRNGCSCRCHAEGCGQAGMSSFDPAFPEPVDQTALNASRGRNGVRDGNQYTIRNSTTRSSGGANQKGDAANSRNETAEQRQAREMAELDALERLLMLEYKARTKAAMEAERLRGNATGSTARRPQPLPEGYKSSTMMDSMGRTGEDNNESMGDGSFREDAHTIREAYALAQDCPVTPPVQCHASHRLQDVMDDVRRVTADPIHSGNRRELQKLLHRHAMAEAPAGDSSEATRKAASEAEANAFGSSLAQIRTSYARPHGAGVVWVPKTDSTKSSSSQNETNTLILQGNTTSAAGAQHASSLSPGAAAAVAVQEKHVTYAA